MLHGLALYGWNPADTTSTYQKHGDFANFQSGSKDFFLIGSGPWNMMTTLYRIVFANWIRISRSWISKTLTNNFFFQTETDNFHFSNFQKIYEKIEVLFEDKVLKTLYTYQCTSWIVIIFPLTYRMFQNLPTFLKIKVCLGCSYPKTFTWTCFDFIKLGFNGFFFDVTVSV